MKQFISLMLVVLLLAALFAGCGQTEGQTTSEIPASAGETQTASAGETQTNPAEEPRTTGPEAPETAETPEESSAAPEDEFDMDLFLAETLAAHPDAGAEELCRAMLESPYFRLFGYDSTEYFYPGLNYEYKPEGVREAGCVVDNAGGSGAVIMVLIPEEGTDPDALAKALHENAMPDWVNFEDPLDSVASYVIEGKVILAMYNHDMQPVEGPVAGMARDFVEIFHAWAAEHPTGSCLELADWFRTHQRICGMDAYEVQEGVLTGFGDYEHEVEIKGFSEGAVFAPQMSPSNFIGYVFRPAEGTDAEAFIAMLRENANLNWGVCVSANTIITETDGDLVLFMMCSE